MYSSRVDPKYIELYNEYLDAPLRCRIFLLRRDQMTGSEEEALRLARELDARFDRPARGEPGWRPRWSAAGRPAC